MHRYHIHFMSINEDSDKANRHTRQVETLEPIEYDTDIEAVQLWAAEEVGAKVAVLLSWQELKGAERPDGRNAAPMMIDAEPLKRYLDAVEQARKDWHSVGEAYDAAPAGKNGEFAVTFQRAERAYYRACEELAFVVRTQVRAAESGAAG